MPSRPSDPSEPLDPRDVDALLGHHDLRTVAADLFALRDSLQRMHAALEQLARTMTVLGDTAARAADAQRASGAADAGDAGDAGDAEVPRPPSAPRAD